MQNRKDTKPTFEGEDGVTPIYDFISMGHIEKLIQNEIALFKKRTPKSKDLYEEGQAHLLNGVFSTWHSDPEKMARFPYPIYVERSKDNRLWDVDGNEYIDFNMGDTPDIFGHAPDNEVTRGIIDHLGTRGNNTFLPDAESIALSKLLYERFKLKYWYCAMTASDANRYAITMARVVTGRLKILMFNFAYHGTLEDCLKWMPEPGKIGWRSILSLRPGEDPAAATSIAEFNDLDSVEEALKKRDVAVLLTEPLLTDGGFTLPKPGFHEGLRELCTKYGTYLLIDETHTQTVGPSGCLGLWDLKPDIWVAGKCIAAGIPAAVYGFTEELGNKLTDHLEDFLALGGVTGLATTSTANSLVVRALCLSLEHNYTKEIFTKMCAAADYLVDGFNRVIKKRDVPFRVDKLGARINLAFTPDPCYDPFSALRGLGVGGYHEYLTLYLYNRGVTVIPLLNMYMVPPQTTREDSDKFIQLFDEAVANMLTSDSVDYHIDNGPSLQIHQQKPQFVKKKEEKVTTSNEVTELNNQAWELLTQMHKDKSNIDKAIELYNKAISIDPNNSESYLKLSEATFNKSEGIDDKDEKKKLYQKVLGYAEKVLKIDSNSSEGHYWSGCSLARLAEMADVLSGIVSIKKGLKELEKSITCDPQHFYSIQARAILSEIYCEVPWPLRNIVKATRLVDEALEMDSNLTFPISIRGKIHVRMNEYEKARELFKRCLNIENPTCPWEAELYDWPDAKKNLLDIKGK